MSNEVTKYEQDTFIAALPAKDREAVHQIDTIIASSGGLAKLQGDGGIAAGIIMANTMQLLRDALTPAVMTQVMKLQGSPLGFKTDRDTEGGYPVEVVKDCIIEARIRGGRMIGNEMNIISSRAYMTKEFYTRALQELEGLTDLEFDFTAPALSQDGKEARVGAVARWAFHGKPMSMSLGLTKASDNTHVDTRICVRVNKMMGVDAILGKAERKLRKRIYERVTGTQFTDADLDDAILVRSQVVSDEAPKPEQVPQQDQTKNPSSQLAEQMKGKKPNKPQPDQPEETDEKQKQIAWAAWGDKDKPPRYIGRITNAIGAAKCGEHLDILGVAVGNAVANGHLGDTESTPLFDAIEEKRSSL